MLYIDGPLARQQSCCNRSTLQTSTLPMDFFDSPAQSASLASLILLLLLKTYRTLELATAEGSDDNSLPDVTAGHQYWEAPSLDLDAVNQATLHHFRLCSTFTFIDEDLGFWVKPRSITWFSRFILQEYDDGRWIQMFCMTKRFVFSFAKLLEPSIKRKDTKYRLAIPVTVRLACTLFKLCHGASLLICSELFAVGRSTMSIMLREVVHSINVLLRSEISWPSGDRVAAIATQFQELCGLPGVLGAIDGTHIAISKPRFGAADYYYFKSGGYSMNCQAVVDSSKRFLDLYVGMPGSTNDSRMLRRSSLCCRGQRGTLWDANHSFASFSPYLLGDAGYPLLPWLMVPHRLHADLPVALNLFNRRLSSGRVVVENAFGLLKSSFRELQYKSDLNVAFLPDVVTCCAILHNVVLQQSHDEVERLLEILRTEEDHVVVDNLPVAAEDNADVTPDDMNWAEGQRKRQDLGIYLSIQRIVPL